MCRLLCLVICFCNRFLILNLHLTAFFQNFCKSNIIKFSFFKKIRPVHENNSALYTIYILFYIVHESGIWFWQMIGEVKIFKLLFIIFPYVFWICFSSSVQYVKLWLYMYLLLPYIQIYLDGFSLLFFYPCLSLILLFQTVWAFCALDF